MAEPGAQYPEFRDRSVVVTGGSSGIGAAIVEGSPARAQGLLHRHRRGREPCAGLSPVARQPASGALPPCRRDIEALRKTVRRSSPIAGPIGVLVNNAARDDRHDFDQVTPEYWDNNQATNLRHVFFAAQAVAPSMREAGGGAIINMSSIAMLNMPDFPAYTTAKAAIIGLTKSLAGKLGRTISASIASCRA